MKRTQSKKSHSWWWDSHISPKNSRWLQENLQEMDEHVKRMLKLIEEDANSFAKKAEMYYRKRPELVHLVEDFYRMYRSLAERYDHVTGELRRSVPPDLQSQGSGISEAGSSSPERRRSKPPGSRAAGFDFFLGSGGSKEGDEFSTLDSEFESESESDGSLVHDDKEERGSNLEFTRLEAELREAKEKLTGYERCGEESFGDSSARYEEELRAAAEKILLCEVEIGRLKVDLQKYESLGNLEEDLAVVQDSASQQKIEMLEAELREVKEKLAREESSGDSSVELWSAAEKIRTYEGDIGILKIELQEFQSFMAQDSASQQKTEILEEELRVARENLRVWESEVSNLRQKLESNDSMLQDLQHQLRSTRLELETNLSDQIEAMSVENERLEAEINRASTEKAKMEDIFRADIEHLKTEVDEIKKTRDALGLKYEMSTDEMKNHVYELHVEHMDLIVGAEATRKLVVELRSRVGELEKDVKRKEETIREGAEEKREAIRQLCFSLEHYRNGYQRLRRVVVGHKGMPVIAS